jgi:hypothetical protein
MNSIYPFSILRLYAGDWELIVFIFRQRRLSLLQNVGRGEYDILLKSLSKISRWSVSYRQ